MTSLVQINQGTAPAGSDGDTVRSAFAKVNSNTAALATQVPLVTTYLSDTNTTLDATYAGKRVCSNMSVPGRTVVLPKANSVTNDQCLLLWNVGQAVYIGFQGSDGTEVAQLNTGDWIVYVSDGSAYWHVQQRGRNGWNESIGGNLTVGGTLTISGTVSGNVLTTGKLRGVNNANLLVNGSGELGNLNWTTSSFGSVVGGYGEGTLFLNGTAINSSTYVLDPAANFFCNAGVQLSIQTEITCGGMSKGAVYIKLEAFDSSGTFLGTVCATPSITVASSAYQWVSATGTTPANTASVRLSKVADSAPVISAFGAGFRRIKVEQGPVPSLYSQEATIAYLQSLITALQGAPALSGRPTFAGKTPWDSGNLANPATTDTPQTFSGAKTFSGTASFSATSAFTGTANFSGPYTGTYTTSTVNLSAPGLVSGIGFNSGGYGATLAYAGGSPGMFQFMDYQRSGYYPITCLTVTQSSDVALKTEVSPISRVLERLRGKRAVSYAMKSDPNTRHIGVIAQEWQDDFPELVVETGADIDEDGDFIAHQYDAAGNEIFGPNGKPESRRALGFNYSNASAVALQAVIELQSVLDVALSRIEALEAK